MDNNDIRKKILEVLYEAKTIRNPLITNNEIIEKLNLKEQSIFFNTQYLHEKNYVKMMLLADGGFFAEITSNGVDIVENTAKLNQLFPTKLEIINSPGTTVNSDNVSISFNNSFNQLYSQIREIGLDNQVEIEERLKKLEEELKKENLSKSKLQNIISYLKTHTPDWVVSAAIQLTIKAITGTP